MPAGDRRGPEGRGAMTGRGLGCCEGNDQPGFTANAVPQGRGRGFRNGAGLGRVHARNCRKSYGRAAAGYVRRAHNDLTNKNETADFKSSESRDREITKLENVANTLTNELEIVKNKIDKLKNN